LRIANLQFAVVGSPSDALAVAAEGDGGDRAVVFT